MSTQLSAPQVRLADHVRACRIDDQMILLDLRSSRYLGIRGPQLPRLTASLLREPQADDAYATASDAASVDRWLHRLRCQHLLADVSVAACPCTESSLIEPVASLSTDDEDRAAGLEWRHLARMWWATLVAARWLRQHNLEDISARVRGLRERHPGRGEGPGAETMHLAAACYLRLRPFASTTHDRCLNDSLTLIHFLATQGLFPQWVIGVRANPFGAHAWVQHDGVVLNDLHERVRRYRPILVV